MSEQQRPDRNPASMIASLPGRLADKPCHVSMAARLDAKATGRGMREGPTDQHSERPRR